MDVRLKDCTICPRDCHVDRTAGQTGYCGQTDRIRAARAALHMWEEPCISGQTGSGTVFFSGCNLGCVFCQNRRIAVGRPADGGRETSGNGRDISCDRLCEIFIDLQKQGACNINLVTPSHFVPQIAQALRQARERGLVIPVVYNTGSYEKAETLRELEGLVDVYLPDFKYVSSSLSSRYSFAEDYFPHACLALEEMVRQADRTVFARQEEVTWRGKTEMGKTRQEGPDDYAGPVMTKGVIVRHLILPGCTEDSKAVLRYLHGAYGNDIYISIMNQYTPLPQYLGRRYPELNRTVTKKEYDEVVDYAISLGVENGFIQEGKTCLESFIPDFDGAGL